MEILHQYFYRKWKVVVKTVIYTVVSALLVGFAIYGHIHWNLSFLFDEWQGYVILVVYSLFTLGMILSAVECFRKLGRIRRGIPAFGIGTDFLMVYDNHGLANTIPFEDCEQVRFKTNYHYRGAPPTLTLIVKYHTKTEPDDTLRFEVGLSELDRPQHEIDKELNKIYKKYKKEHEAQN